MINLIPPAARKSVVVEYWLRVVSVWLFLFGTGCMIVAVLLLPTYMIVRGQIAHLDGQVAATAEHATTFDEGAAELKKASTAAIMLTAGASTTPFSTYLKLLEQIAGDSVTLHSISYTNDQSGEKIIISGMATTRVGLAAFRDALEAQPAFTDVVLPIESLIKDRDLPFSMTMSVAAQTNTTP
jgi:Tfp pilus assembly protein PilN